MQTNNTSGLFRQLLVFTGILLPLIASANAGPGGDRRDTASAVVVYDDRVKFMPDPEYDARDYSMMIDSLTALDSIPVNLLRRVEVFRDLSAMNDAELASVIDTLFESRFVTKPVLNAVHTYVSTMANRKAAPRRFGDFVPYDESPYPANVFYGNWNDLIPFPARNDLAEFDTTLTLLLTDSLAGCGYHPPFVGVVTSRFGWRYGRNHNGIDIDLEVWDPVYAAFPGVVRVARYYQGFGRVVVIRHYNGLETVYAHLHRFKVASGDVVEAGQVVGLGGSSGNSTGSHLHFEIRFQGVPIKPSQIIDFNTYTLRSCEVRLRRSGVFLAAIPDSEQYEVRKGDYLYKIAKDFGLTLDQICNMNGIRRSQPLRVGQKLIVGS